MKQNVLTYLLLPFLLALLVTACKDDTLPASPAEEEEAGSGVYVSVVVNTGGSNASRVPTPGEDGDDLQAGTVEESSVYDLNVFFFQEDVDESTGERLGINSPNAANIPVHSLYFSSEDLHPDASNNYDAVYSVTKEVSAETNLQIGQTYDVLVVANYGKDMSIVLERNTLAELREIKYHAMPETGGVHHFLMSSAGPDVSKIIIEANNPKNNPSKVTVNVERTVARVDYHLAYPEAQSYFTPKNAPNDKVKIIGATLVNKYNSQSYVFKRVTQDINISPTSDVVYLGDEKGSSTEIASNYVVDPKTLNPPTDNIEHEYNEIYFPTYTNWGGINWREPSTEIFSKQNGVTYGFLDYTQENVVSAEVVSESRAEYCTGIVFKAKYTPAGITAESDGSFYQYNNKFYGTLDKIKNELGVGYIGPADMERYGITKYEGGICYYTYWIKHADDGDDTKVSPMEYAIVRNNIYQINVTGVSGIGTVTPTDYGLYLTCTVVDWVEENAIDIDFTESTAYKGDFVGVSVKKDENAVLVAYSQDNEFRDAQFTFRMQTPRGATWTAHLSNPDDFELVEDYIGVGTGTDSSNEGLVTLTVRARRPFEEGSERKTALYITTNVFDNPIAFNQGSGESTLFPGENTFIRIRQVSTTDYDNTQEITDDNQGN